MKKSGQWGLILGPFGILLAVSLLWLFLLKPALISFARAQIPKVNQSQDFVEVAAQGLDISLLKLQVTATDVEVRFKEKLGELKPLRMGQIRLQLDLFKLLVGQVGLSKVQLHEARWEYQNKKSSTSFQFKELPLDDLFKVLPQVPVEQFFVLNSEVLFKDSELELDLLFQIPQLQIQNKKSSLAFSLRKILLQATNPQKAHINAELNLEAQLHYQPQNTVLDIGQIKLKVFDSLLQFSGKINQFKNLLVAPEGQIKLESDIHFDDLRTVGLTLFPQKNRMASVTGFLRTDGDLNFKTLNDINGQINFQTKQVSVDHFKLGQAQVRVQVKKNQILINQIEVEHPSSLASLKEIEIEQKAPYRFKANLHLERMDLQKLFISMGFNDIPAGLLSKGDATCEGAVQPELEVDCQVKSQLNEIWVKSDIKNLGHIVKIKNAEITGPLHVDLKGLRYTADLKVGGSVGKSQGQVLFAEGYKATFETEKLSFNDVESLADLNFKGDLKIKGQTAGGLSAATIDAEATFTNAEIDRFHLGTLEAKLGYEKGFLSLKQLKGILGQSTYQGDLVFDFHQAGLAAQLEMKKLLGEDILSALKDRIPIPFNLSGQGSATIDLKGPFDFWKLSYSLKAQLKQGQLAGENFEDLRFNLKADGAQILLADVFATKNRSRVRATGAIITTKKEPQLALQLKSEPFYLEESDLLLKYVPNLTGQTWIDGQVRGDFEEPEVTLNFNAKQVSFENVEYPGSQGQMQITRKDLRFNGQLFGRQIQSDLVWPWSEQDPFSIRLQVRDLNPLMLLPLVSLPQASGEFYSRLNADVDLHSNHRDLKAAEGSIKMNDFIIQRGALYLKLSKTANLVFKKGLQQMDPVEFSGEGSNLKLNLIHSRAEETKLTVSGDVQLKQFQFLVPFAQSFSGRLQVDSQILLRGQSFELFGDGEMTDGLVGIKGFPQAIENINTPIEFSKSKIILSDISAQIGNSELAGQGQIEIKGAKQVIVNVQAASDQIELTFPEQITTAGKVDLSFFGSWLPYTLKVDYKVSRGLVEKDFGQETAQDQLTLKGSPYLPLQQIELQTPSVLLDVNVDMSQGVIVKNQILEGDATGRLHIQGTPESPTIEGQINIKPGSKLIFKDKQFDIQTANIRFPGGPDIYPDIYMTANARVSDYDINLLVQGVPTKNLTIKPTSQPPLSESDIFTLLALGITSSKMDQNLSSKTQQEQTGLEVLAALSNQSQINKKFQEKFGLTVQLAPTVDSTKNIAVPKVVVSKKLKKNINASYSRPLAGETQNQEWKLQYLFNPNKSVILNYQNVESNQQDQLRNTNKNDQGILGLDFEYKKEFK